MVDGIGKELNPKKQELFQSLYKADAQDGKHNLFKSEKLNKNFANLYNDGKVTAEEGESFLGQMFKADMKNGIIGDGDIFNKKELDLETNARVKNSFLEVFLGPLMNKIIEMLKGKGVASNPLKTESDRSYGLSSGDIGKLGNNGYIQPGSYPITAQGLLGPQGQLGHGLDRVYTGQIQPLTPAQKASIANVQINENLDPKQFGLSKEQLNNACTIAKVVIQECQQAGKSAEETKQAVVIALSTAMQESSLKNLNYGDRDSLGLFQQRPSIKDGKGGNYWGTQEQVKDPIYSTRRFVKELFKKGDYMNKSVTKAAQDVQRSAYPDAYAKHEPKARALVNAMLA